MGYISKNPKLDSEILTDQGATSVTNPPSGSSKFINRNKKLWSRDSNGVEQLVGSGAGEKNYIGNPSDANAGWTASAAGITVDTTSTTGNLPELSTLTAIAITPVSGTTDYVYNRFTIDPADKGKKLKIQFALKTAAAAGDVVIEMYSNAASNYGGAYTSIAVTLSSIPALSSGVFQTEFDSTTADYYEIRFRRAAGTTALYISSVIIGPGIIAQSAAVGPISFTLPTPAGFTITASSDKYIATRIGSSLRVQGSLTVAGSSNTSAGFILPTGLTLDTTNLRSASTGQALGTFLRHKPSATGSGIYSGDWSSVVFFDGSTTGTLFIANTVDSNTLNKVNGNALLAASDRVDFEFEVPIAEWSGNGSVNLGPGAQVEIASNDGSGGTSAGSTYNTGSVAGASRFASVNSVTGSNSVTQYLVTFQSPIQALNDIKLEVSTDGGVTWDGGGSDIVNIPMVVQNQSKYGMRVVPNNSTSVYVQFGNQGTVSSSATYAASAAAWSGPAGVSTYLWRLKKVNPSSPVGFGLAGVDGSSGLYKAGQAPGIVSGVAIGAGYLGETISATVAAVSAAGTNTNGLVTSVALTPGKWKISGTIISNRNGATIVAGNQNMKYSLLGNGGTPADGTVRGKDLYPMNGPLPIDYTDVTLPIAGYTVNISVNTTYYLYASNKYSAGTPTWDAFLEAVRI